MGCVQRSEPSEPRSSQQRFLPAASAGRNSRLGTPGWLRVRPDHQHPDRPARHGVCFEVLLVVGTFVSSWVLRRTFNNFWDGLRKPCRKPYVKGFLAARLATNPLESSS